MAYGTVVSDPRTMLELAANGCKADQWKREIPKNAIESGAKNVLISLVGVDVDGNSVRKWSVTDNGCGMTGPDQELYSSDLFQSSKRQGPDGNFGFGAKVSVAKHQPAGLLARSWVNGSGTEVRTSYTGDSDHWGVQPLEDADGNIAAFRTIDDSVKPELIDDSGTQVIIMGTSDNAEADPDEDMLGYLNRRFFDLGDCDMRVERNNRRYRVTGMKSYLANNTTAKGVVSVDGAKVHWHILKEKPAPATHGHVNAGHFGVLCQDELYELSTGNAGRERLQQFGATFCHSRVVLYTEPVKVNASLTRNTLTSDDAEPLPFSRWASEFRDKLPEPIRQLNEEMSGRKNRSKDRNIVLDMMSKNWQAYAMPAFQLHADGTVEIDTGETLRGKLLDKKPASAPRPNGGRRKTEKAKATSGKQPELPKLYLPKGVNSEAKVRERNAHLLPKPVWVSVAAGNREKGDALEGRAAQYLAETNELILNEDYEGFQQVFAILLSERPDLADDDGAEYVLDELKLSWEKQLSVAWTGLMRQITTNPSAWTPEQTKAALSPEALTAAVAMIDWIVEDVKRYINKNAKR